MAQSIWVLLHLYTFSPVRLLGSLHLVSQRSSPCVLDGGKDWTEERTGRRKGLDGGKDWTEERTGRRKGLDGGKDWTEERTGYWP